MFFGDYPYSGDYVFRNILNTPPFGVRNLGGIFDDAVDQWNMAVNDPQTLSRIHQEGAAIVERANQILNEYESVYTSTKAKIESIQKINVKVANFLMEQLNAEQGRHEPIVKSLSSELTGVADVGVLQNLVSQLETALSSLKSHYDRVMEIASKPPNEIEAMTPDMITKLGNILKYLVYGVVALAAVKYLPDIIKKFKK